jgi:hypothetical protein
MLYGKTIILRIFHKKKKQWEPIMALNGHLAFCRLSGMNCKSRNNCLHINGVNCGWQPVLMSPSAIHNHVLNDVPSADEHNGNTECCKLCQKTHPDGYLWSTVFFEWLVLTAGIESNAALKQTNDNPNSNARKQLVRLLLLVIISRSALKNDGIRNRACWN